MYMDWTYVILVLPALLLSMLASANVNGTFNKFSTVTSARRISGAEAAERVLRANGVHDVRIEHIAGNLSDHFDPKTNVIRLSDSVFNSTSIAAVGVACHEAGHAVQYASDYGPVKLRTAIVPVTSFGAKLCVPLILAGLLLSSYAPQLFALVYVGIACFGLSTVFQLITLPVEFNASNRAMKAIAQSDILDEEEMQGAKKVLRAAALTYVAALAVSLTQLLRFILLYGGRRRN